MTGRTNRLTPCDPVTLSPSSIEIWPEPSPDEREAILVAVARLLRGERAAAAPVVSPWAAAGRRDALRAHQGSESSGWGRERSAAW